MLFFFCIFWCIGVSGKFKPFTDLMCYPEPPRKYIIHKIYLIKKGSGCYSCDLRNEDWSKWKGVCVETLFSFSGLSFEAI